LIKKKEKGMSEKPPEDQEKKMRQALASQALEQFDNAKYADTKSSLTSLASQHKVTAEKDLIALEHNSTVTTFSTSPRSDTTVRDTLRALQRIRARAVEYRAGKSTASTGQVSGEGSHSSNPSGDESGTTSSASSHISDTTPTSDSPPSTTPETFDPEQAADPQLSTMLFNEAALCCSLGKFRSALSRLDALFQNIMLLDDWLAVRTCYLLLDVYIHVHRGLDSGSEALQHLKSCGAKVLEALEQRTTPNEDEGSTLAAGKGTNEETEPSSLKSIPDLKFHLKLYRAKLQLIASNSTNAKKEIKAALDIYNKDIKNDKTGTSAVAKLGTTPALFLKANLEYVRENFKKSVKLLNAALSNNALAESSYMNNMGCINFQSQRYSISSLYFARALTLIDDSNNGNGTMINRSEVLYNIGLQMLMCGKDVKTAFECFHRASVDLHMRPRVWIRMAECCVAEHERLLDSEKEKRMENGKCPPSLSVATQHTATFQNDMVTAIIHGHRVMLPTSFDDAGVPTRLIDAGDTATMSMSFAIMCLRNVLYLTERSGTHQEEGGKNAKANKNSGNSGTSESKSKGAATGAATMNESTAVRHAALASLSYCSLCQSHPIIALDYARRLLSQVPKCSSVHQYLGNTYAAEALCTLNRCTEALAHMNAAVVLSESISSNSSASISESKHSTRGVVSLASSPTSAHARAALCVNLASIRIQQNELEMAEKSLRQALTLSPTSPDALRTMVYLRLRQGEPQSAMKLLQERRPSTV
jgi:CCR4-NOT transcription complex subunit 10